jgi:hypothetical protein
VELAIASTSAPRHDSKAAPPQVDEEIQALADGVTSGESSASDDTVKPTRSEQTVQRFEHYELVTLKEHSVTAKIIDLGLAKTLDESASEAGLVMSNLGGVETTAGLIGYGLAGAVFHAPLIQAEKG